jgi:hypothetical protein
MGFEFQAAGIRKRAVRAGKLDGAGPEEMYERYLRVC